MAERERTNQGKNEKVNRKHHMRQQETQPSSVTLHAWDLGLLPLPETPFHPRMNEHAAILSNIHFPAQRQDFVMRLQQTYGNRYVQRLIKSVSAQAKLTVNAPNDVYEQEADRVADAVTRTIQAPISRQEEEDEIHMKTVLQRQEEEEELQMQPVEKQHSMVSHDVENRINDARGNGQILSEAVKEPLEKAFGADFGDVRIHTDSEANELNQELNAKAFTAGQDIFFREGEYSPGSGSGRKLIAHELTHVVQQSTRRNRGSVSSMMMEPAVAELGMANVVWRQLQDDIQPDEIKAKHPGLLKGDGMKKPLELTKPYGYVSCWLGLALALTETAADSPENERLGVVADKMFDAHSSGGVATSGTKKLTPGSIVSWGEKGSGHVGVVADDGEMIAGYNQSAYINGGKGSGYYNVGTVKKGKKGKKAGMKIRTIA